MSDAQPLRIARAARQLGLPTRAIVDAIYYRRILYVMLDGLAHVSVAEMERLGALDRDELREALGMEATPGVPDGWELWPDGQPYPAGVALDDHGEPYEAAGWYALRAVYEDAGAPAPDADAWDTLMALRRLGFDVTWVGSA